MPQSESAVDWRRETQRLTHEFNKANLGRSVRDCVWYAGQVAVMILAYQRTPLGLYPVLAAIALLVCVATGREIFTWRRELKRDEAAGRT